MKIFTQTFRLITIAHVLAKHRIDGVLLTIPIFNAFHMLSYLNPWHWVRKDNIEKAESLRLAIEELGPVFIKFGQALSTRPDILPLQYASSLTRLQDDIPAFASSKAISKIEKALKMPLDAVFHSFDNKPLASASIAQVHAATLKNGQEVVVKVVRPFLRQQIALDISLMKRVAIMLEKYWKKSRYFKLVELVTEFETHKLDELDMQREAANASQLKRNFTNSSMLYVPEIIWEYTRHDILVIEKISCIPVTDKKALQAHGLNIPRIAALGVEIFFTQVFRDAYFHADMHTGNIFISPLNKENPYYVCVDFGLMGSLSFQDQRYLAYNLYAFFERDYRKVAELHLESGWVSKDTRIDELESAIRAVCEPIFARPLKDISFGRLLMQLFAVGKRFSLEVQPQLLLLQKTLFAVEGLGRQLYPELDLWKTAKPFLEKWLKSRLSLRGFAKEMHKELPFYLEQLPHLPKLFYDVLELQKNTLTNLPKPKLEKLNVTSKAKSMLFLFTVGCVLGLIGGRMLWG